MSTHLRHDLELLHQSLLTGKLPRSLKWRDAVELVVHLGDVNTNGRDEFTFAIGTQRAFFKHPHTDEMETADVARLRKLLRDSVPAAKSVPLAQPNRVVVVIDHRVAHIYRDFNTSRPESEATVLPYDPFGFHHHLIHRKEAHYQGERIPEETSFYEDVSKELLSADEIVLIGHGTGKSSAVEYLSNYLNTHHHNIAHHVIATETADLSALTGPEIEVIAKRHMISVV